MGCKNCAKEKGYHSFEFLGRTKSDDAIYYSNISKAKEHRLNEETIVDFIAHMDEASITSWIWIFDCRGLEAIHMPSMKILREFTQLIQERYKFVLKHIYIVYPNWKMNIMLSMVQPFLKDETRRRLVVCESALQFFQSGVNHEQVKILLK